MSHQSRGGARQCIRGHSPVRAPYRARGNSLAGTNSAKQASGRALSQASKQRAQRHASSFTRKPATLRHRRRVRVAMTARSFLARSVNGRKRWRRQPRQAAWKIRRFMSNNCVIEKIDISDARIPEHYRASPLCQRRQRTAPCRSPRVFNVHVKERTGALKND